MDRAHGPLGPVLRPRTPKQDFELDAGARAHFEDPLYYSATYDERVEDAEYYLALAKERGAVLEHGVGNGRIALPIARAGSAITGIDHTRPMLDHFSKRLKKEAPAVRRRVTLVEGDIRTAQVGKRFPLVICPFNTALHLYTREDVELWLERVREHLLADGELVFDISMPIAKDLARNPNVAYRIPPFDHPTAGRVSYREHFDYDPVRQVLFVSMFFEPIGKRSKRNKRAKNAGEFMTPLAHRQFYPREMEALLHYNGFEVTEVYGDFAKGPLVPGSDVMVWHARPRRSRAKGGRLR